MPELPDIVVYVECLDRRVVGRELRAVRVFNPFLVRTFDPSISEAEGKAVRGLRRLGKRIVFELDGNLFLVLHLMIAGRLQWKNAAEKPPGRTGLAVFEFASGWLILTEAGTKRRASLHFVRGEDGLKQHQPGGLEIFETDLASFTAALRSGNHTLKRSLTNPRLFSGIGNAYSDEILHRAKLSPLTWTSRLTDAECERLFAATRETMRLWIERFRAEVGDGFPKKVTAFRPDMAVHGKFGRPCPVCGTAVRRIVYAENETNYCPRCQTGGKVLADRALSRLLKGDWPSSVEEWEAGH
jgi:formamidopyrimidine-DNA glycosylase